MNLLKADPARPSLRFLVEGWSPDVQGIPTRQGWCASGELSLEVQSQDGCGRLKLSVGGIPAHESSISQELADELLEHCPSVLHKLRYLHAPAPWHGGLDTGRWYIDVYQDPWLQGLTIARLQGKVPPELPAFLGREVTDDPRYRGLWLSRHGLPDPARQAYELPVRRRAEEVEPAWQPPGSQGQTLVARLLVEATSSEQAGCLALVQSISGQPGMAWQRESTPKAQDCTSSAFKGGA